MKTTESLIASLTEECRPVGRVSSVSKTTAGMLLFGFSFSVVSLLLLGTRDLSSVLFPRFWLLETGLISLLAASAVWCAFQLSIPGSEISRPWRLPVVLLATWASLLVTGITVLALQGEVTSLWPLEGINCAVLISTLLFIPTAMIVIALRRACPTVEKWATFAAIVAGGAFAVLGIQLHCEVESVSHHLAYHMIPVLLMASLGLPFGRRLFRR